MVTNLKSWLRRNPQPHAIRFTTPDEEERELQLSASVKNRWRDAADALEEMNAVRVEALDKDGKVLRVATLREDDGPSTAESRAGSVELARSKETAALALVAREVRLAAVEGYQAGADGASRGQDNLVQVVNILTAQWSGTMNALQSLSMQLGKALLAAGGGDGGEEDDGLGGQIQQLLGLAVMRQMGMGPAQAEDHTKKNGAPKPKEK